MTTLVVITGGSRGLGRAIALTAPAGSTVLEVSRTGGTPGTEHVAADLADPGAWARVSDQVAAAVARRDWDRIVLVHAAGVIQPIGFAGEVSATAYATSVLVNSAAGQVLGDRFLAAVRDLGSRRQFCWISSGAASSAYPGWSAYCAGKAAADHWVRTVGAEQRLRGGVEVCAVAPGVVATDMQAAIRATDERDFPAVERFRSLHADGALRDADDTARQLWAVLDAGVTPGDVLDLRDV
jgi:benzil reductase ((S)-benzoin forming)